MTKRSLFAAALAASLLASAASAETARYTAIFGGKNVGHLTATTEGDTTRVDYDYKNNGRGPSSAETIRVGSDGLPVAWTIAGATTFGSKVAESFSRSGSRAQWVDSTGKGSATVTGPALYVAQSASPWADAVYASALLRQPGMEIAALPGGRLKLEKGETVAVTGEGGALQVTRYDLTGIDTSPETMLIDPAGKLFAVVSPSAIIVRKGYEGEEVRLRKLAADWATERFTRLQKESAHRYDGPVRIRNVRLFDPKTRALTAPVSVLVAGRTIAAVEPIDSPATPGETLIDGAGGTLVPGLFEMHAHLGQEDAMLNLLAGITSVRDMGNDNEVLDALIERIDAGIIAGPHVVRAGFIEGKSPFNANNGILVETEQQAIEAVRWYAARGYWQIKIYNSMNPAFVPAMVREAHRLGLRVGGHVPAFSTADAMLEAGYDEMTHINQFMLGWVIQPGEDTRTLFRLTALKRLPALDLNSAKVQHTIGLMVSGRKAIDPTLGIHEMLTRNRDGEVPPGAVDYFDHLPIGTQRALRKALVDTSAPGDAAAYRGAFDKIMETVRMLHDRGVLILFGTDTGGSFTYHRELELYQQAGFSPGEILARASLESAAYLGRDQNVGSIDKGKLADFFLIPGDPTRDLKAIKRIAMVAKEGAFYYPAEIYPRFGIRPFAGKPEVTSPPAPEAPSAAK